MLNWLFSGNQSDSDLESVYNAKELKVNMNKAIEHIASLTAFKMTVITKTAIFNNAAEIKNHLEYVKDRFKWFHYDQSNFDCAKMFYSKDEQGIANIHLTGYIIMSQYRNGKFLFRGCYVEFHERVTFAQIACMVFACVGMVAAAAAGAGSGATVGLCVDPATLGLGSVFGAVVGSVVGAGGAIISNVNESRRRKAVEEQLGIDIYNASTDRVNGSALVEALLLHSLVAEQNFTLSGTEVRITGVNEKRK